MGLLIPGSVLFCYVKFQGNTNETLQLFYLFMLMEESNVVN